MNSPRDFFRGSFQPFHKVALQLLSLSSSIGKQQKSSGVQKTQGPVLHTGYALYVIDRRFTTAQFQLSLRFRLNLLDLHWPYGHYLTRSSGWS